MTRRAIPSRRIGLLTAAALTALLAAPAAAQEAPSAGVCPDGVIEHVFVDNHSIFDTSDPGLDPRFRWAYSLANKLHVRTTREFIGRELLFDRGDCYDPILLEESGRLLRAYDFVAHADVYGVRQDNGNWHAVVDTEDEWTTQVEVKFDVSDRVEFEELEIREKNILGTGQSLEFFYRTLEATLAYGLRYETPQLFRTRWDFAMAAGRTRAGKLLHQEIRYPFLGETGKWAMREWFHYRDRLFDYVLPRDPVHCPVDGPDCRILVPVRQQGFHLAALRRFGQRGNLTVLGGGISVQSLRYPGDPATAITLVRGRDYDQRETAPVTLRAPAVALTTPLESVRGIVLLGKRNITWQRRSGLDSFQGEEDVRVGAEIEMAAARSLPGFDSDNDMYVAADFYAAAGPPDLFIASRIRVDGRRGYDVAPGEPEMRDVLAESEIMAYVRPHALDRHTLLLRAAASGGWNPEIPFQLSLGGERAVRGWPREAFPGGRRVVLTAEDRWYHAWLFPDVADIGTSLFLDLGRIWPGEAPYGVDSGWRGTLGTGLRINFPAGGTNTFRIDAAFPVGPGARFGDFQLLIGVGEYLGVSAPFLDPQLARSRIPPITGNLLHFPN